MVERGAIRNLDSRQQIADFTKLRWGAITPTDIDEFIDFSGKLFVFFEGKHGTTVVPRGQQLALERLCDACHSQTLCAAGFIVHHNTPTHRAIDYAEARVTQYRWRNAWHLPGGDGITLLEGIERIRRIVFPRPPSEHAEWIAAYDEGLTRCGQVN